MFKYIYISKHYRIIKLIKTKCIRSRRLLPAIVTDYLDVTNTGLDGCLAFTISTATTPNVTSDENTDNTMIPIDNPVIVEEAVMMNVTI